MPQLARIWAFTSTDDGDLDFQFVNLGCTMFTVEVTEHPGRKPISTRVVYKLKNDEKGAPSRFKARIVARGFEQLPGRDKFETCSPVARVTTIRILLACAGPNGAERFEVLQYNAHREVKDGFQQFLDAPLEQWIFMDGQDPESLRFFQPSMDIQVRRSSFAPSLSPSRIGLGRAARRQTVVVSDRGPRALADTFQIFLRYGNTEHRPSTRPIK